MPFFFFLKKISALIRLFVSFVSPLQHTNSEPSSNLRIMKDYEKAMDEVLPFSQTITHHASIAQNFFFFFVDPLHQVLEKFEHAQETGQIESAEGKKELVKQLTQMFHDAGMFVFLKKKKKKPTQCSLIYSFYNLSIYSSPSGTQMLKSQRSIGVSIEQASDQHFAKNE